jgi:hypothetical protein
MFGVDQRFDGKRHSSLTACPILGLQNSPHYTPTRQMATAMFAETLVNTKYSTWLSPESRSYTLNSSRENIRTRITVTLPLNKFPAFKEPEGS